MRGAQESGLRFDGPCCAEQARQRTAPSSTAAHRAKRHGSTPRQAARQHTVARRATVPRSRPTARPSGNKAAVEQSQAVLRREAAEAAKVGRRSRPTALRRARPSGNRAAALDDPARSASRAQPSGPSRLAPCCPRRPRLLSLSRRARHSGTAERARPFCASTTSPALEPSETTAGTAQNGGVCCVFLSFCGFLLLSVLPFCVPPTEGQGPPPLPSEELV